MRPQSAKAKGRRLQQWVRDLLIKKFDLLADDVRSTSMGAGGEDVQLSPLARSFFPYTIECKNRESWKRVYDDYEQAKGHSQHEPLLVIKMNGKAPLVIVDAEHFINLVVKGKPVYDDGK